MVSVLINEMSPIEILFNICFVYCFENKPGNSLWYPKSDHAFSGKLTLRGYQPIVLENIYRIDIKRLPNPLNTISPWCYHVLYNLVQGEFL